MGSSHNAPPLNIEEQLSDDPGFALVTCSCCSEVLLDPLLVFVYTTLFGQPS